jgi:hypothetical protein
MKIPGANHQPNAQIFVRVLDTTRAGGRAARREQHASGENDPAAVNSGAARRTRTPAERRLGRRMS